MEIQGKYSVAKVFTDMIETSAVEQIKLLCDQPFTEGCNIRIMPDVHSGEGCVIGFTANLGDLVIPNIVGVDIGCGMLTVELGKTDIDFGRLDSIIRSFIPSGENVHEPDNGDSGAETVRQLLTDLLCREKIRQMERIELSLGTLGGGNHFIEVDIDDEGYKYLVIHTGSRSLGKRVADYYQEQAVKSLGTRELSKEDIKKVVDEYRQAGRQQEIQAALRSMMNANTCQIPDKLRYLTGELREAYLHDMRLCQTFATMNRHAIASKIVRHLLGKELTEFNWFETVHNYVDFESNIIRKGAVSARKDERLLIPINMHDGSLVCVGKGNEDWNCSAPHGAGRLYSRSAARKLFSVESFKDEMQGIYTTSVSDDTLDECPMAYKPLDAILDNITPTVDVVKIIKPVYNFKAS